MDLWIRSQDRERIFKVNNIGVYDDGDIVQVFETGDAVRLANYKTKERALEVLDEIQNKINNFEAELYVSTQIYIGNVEIPSLVYEMPRE